MTQQAYWINTPASTCIVVVNGAGRIVDTAPRLWQAWLRRSWTSFDRAHQRQHGVAYRRERLDVG